MSTLNNSNPQTLADSGANKRPPMLERGNYIPWESRFRRFLIYNLEGRRNECGFNQNETLYEANGFMIAGWCWDINVQFEPHVLASKAKKAAKNHDPLALIAHSHASSSQSHAHSSYSPQPYYVTHRGVTRGFSRGQAYNCHYASDCQKPRVRDAKYFREQMFLAIKDEAGSTLNNEENDFMLDTSYADGNAETVPSYDAKAVSEVNASSKVYEQMRHEKRKTIIQTSDDEQIDSNIIFDDPYVENNGGTSKIDSSAHDEYHAI
ncbi:hypothetical protein Tco_1238098 [Tanacetum coccineum]